MRQLTVPVPAEAAALPDLPTYASTTAARYGLDPELFHAVIGCESGWNPRALGDHGTSWGIAQLHNPVTDWGVSTSSALNPYLSIEIMAKAWAAHQEGRWTCYQQIAPHYIDASSSMR